MALRNCQGWDMDISQKSGIPQNHPSRLRIRSTKTQIPIKTVILHPITLVHLSIFGALGGSSYFLVKPMGFGYPVHLPVVTRQPPSKIINSNKQLMDWYLSMQICQCAYIYILQYIYIYIFESDIFISVFMILCLYNIYMYIHIYIYRS